MNVILYQSHGLLIWFHVMNKKVMGSICQDLEYQWCVQICWGNFHLHTNNIMYTNKTQEFYVVPWHRKHLKSSYLSLGSTIYLLYHLQILIYVHIGKICCCNLFHVQSSEIRTYWNYVQLPPHIIKKMRCDQFLWKYVEMYHTWCMP